MEILTETLSQSSPPVCHDAARQLDESKIVLCLLLPPDEELPEPVQLRRAPLHDPPLRLVALHRVLHLSSVAHVGVRTSSGSLRF